MKCLDGVLIHTFHALDNGTTWSISTSDANVHVAPSYGLNQLPLTAAQLELCTTLLPSRCSTTSRVSQVPD